MAFPGTEIGTLFFQDIFISGKALALSHLLNGVLLCIPLKNVN